VKTAPIVPARLARDTDGTLVAPDFGDIYHPRHGALEQARYVFLAGNGLPMRWRRRERFVILETGVGLGNNFLAAWAAWRDDTERCAQLHFISIEARPLPASELATLPRDAALAPLAARLAAAWPPLTCNLHRLSFEAGHVQLLLALGDVAGWLPQIDAAVDAFFLDGFSPAKNPDMWQPRLFKAMARIAAPDATVATWSAARAVREGLGAADFAWARADGAGDKRDMTVARFAPHAPLRLPPRRCDTVRQARGESVVIVGGGLAGCATAWALAEHGHECVLLERGAKIAGEGSGNAAGLFHGVVNRDDGRHARFNRAAALEVQRHVALAIAAHGVAGGTDGLLRLETPDGSIDIMRATARKLGLPEDYVRVVTQEEASALAGVAIAAPAWFYPGGGWVEPGGLARSFLERAAGRVELRLGAEVAALRRKPDGRWLLMDAAGNTLASTTTVVLANAGGALGLLGAREWPVARQRGQLSGASASRWPVATQPRLPVAGSGYVLPPIDGCLWFGATSQEGDDSLTVRREDHRQNVARLGQLLSEAPDIGVETLDARVSFRYSCIDRLPLVGAVPLSALGPALLQGLTANASARPEQPRFARRVPGLFVYAALGSRGIAWSALAAQVLAAMVSGAPAPLEADLLDAIDPARFASRTFRRAGTAPTPAAQRPEGPIAAGSAEA
jgi:tRNA 5-methylaminomethyl-2-thiouridine biosynthesis bifunctional protein